MILFTIGTSEPFDRLIAVADDVALASGEHVVVQGGRSECEFRVAAFEPFLPYSQLAAAVAEARVIVTHAGVGSILLALGAWKVPIVVPRLRRFGEAVDDHQLAFAERISAMGLAHLVETPAELPHLVGGFDGRLGFARFETPSLATALREHLAVSLGPAADDTDAVVAA